MFELCLELGYPHPDYLLRALTSQQVTDWVAVYNKRPWGYLRHAMGFGTLAALYYNAHKDRGRARTWQDFFPMFTRRPDVVKVATGEQFRKLIEEYNVQRGYTPDGSVKVEL